VAKTATVFVCQTCGTQYSQWLGKCNACGGWNTIAEELEVKESNAKVVARTGSGKKIAAKPERIDQISTMAETRLVCGIREFDTVLGGGLVLGSVTLIGGDPGIGKSTLCLQISKKYADQNKKVLYVTGEESGAQIKLRAERLKALSPNLYILCETNVALINRHVESLKPDLFIVDSIQTVYRDEIQSAPGTVSQVRECAASLWQNAKDNVIPLLLVGHITKDGSIAGPKVLEHMVDTVLYFEGERHGHFRILRGIKNRFGSTNEIGIFEMKAEGLSEVLNPSEVLIHERPVGQAGSAIVATLEGSRALMVEIQALVTPTNAAMPRRVFTGIDSNRAAIIIAVLEKKCGLHLSGEDIFINVAGGLSVDEPAADLAIALAIVSSFRNIALDPSMMVAGEIGLTGEIRTVSQIDKRLSETEKLGFRSSVLPSGNKKSLSGDTKNKKINWVGQIQEVLGLVGSRTAE
jgi:DNA repair protein RadA/Sms